MTAELVFMLPVERIFEVQDYELPMGSLDYLRGFLKHMGFDAEGDYLAVIKAAYRIALDRGLTEIAMLTPQWLGRNSAYLKYKGTGKPTVYVDFKVPHGVMLVLFGFISKKGSIDEVLIDLLPKCDVFIPLSPPRKMDSGYLHMTPAMPFVEGDEVRIRLVTYNPDALEDLIMPYGLVFYSAAGSYNAYWRDEE